MIIAGSEEMTGAAVLAAEGAYRIGTGLVKVLTSPKGVHVIRNRLPEALTQNRDRKEVLLQHSISFRYSYQYLKEYLQK